MQKFRIILLFIMVTSIIQTGCSQDKTSKNTKTSKGIVEVYYFHFTHRCVTCKAVEAQSRKALKELYPDLMEKGKITFSQVNLDQPDGKEKGRAMNVSGQTLLILNGDKRINLTNEGFMFARSNPEKLKSIIKKNVDGLL